MEKNSRNTYSDTDQKGKTMQKVLEVNNPNGSTSLYGPFKFGRTAGKQARKAGLTASEYQIRDLNRGRNLLAKR